MFTEENKVSVKMGWWEEDVGYCCFRNKNSVDFFKTKFFFLNSKAGTSREK